jgi:hypothetical protein
LSPPPPHKAAICLPGGHVAAKPIAVVTRGYGNARRRNMAESIPGALELIWRAAASFSGGLCYLVVRRDLPPRKAIGVIVTAIAFGLFVADWVAQKTGIPGGVIGLAFGFGAIWVVDRIDDGSLPKMLKGLLLRWVQK